MTRVLVWITDDEEGRTLAGMRESEIGIGHDSEFMVSLSPSPIVAQLEEVIGQLEQYWGPGGSVAIRVDPTASQAGMARYHDGSSTGAAHGLAWEIVDGRPADELATLPWFDQDDRSVYLAGEILAGRLSNATEEERDLAVSWSACAEGLSEDRPRYGIRETPVRAAIREYLFELRAALAAAGGAPDPWKRTGEVRELADGTVLEVDNVRSDGGIYRGWFCVSRYPDRGQRWSALLERYYL